MAFKNHKFYDKIVFSCCDIHGGLLFLSYKIDISADEQQFYLFRRLDELTSKKKKCGKSRKSKAH